MSHGSDICWRRRMAKKRKLPKMTPEELAERELHDRWLRERIAYHLAKAEEEEARRAEKQS
jgi:hypothetical protein